MRRLLVLAVFLYCAVLATASAATTTAHSPTLMLKRSELPGFAAAKPSVKYARTGEEWAVALGDNPEGLEARAMKRLHFQRGVVERFLQTRSEAFYAVQMFRTHAAGMSETYRRDEKLLLGEKTRPGFQLSHPHGFALATLFSEFAPNVGGAATISFTVGRCALEVSAGLDGISSREAAAVAPIEAAHHLARRLRRICG
jgi:hypothetical protein